MLPTIFEASRLNPILKGFLEDDSFLPKKAFSGLSAEFSKIRSDVKETDSEYIISSELPGYEKEDISAELHNGYLTISAKHSENKEEEKENEKYLLRERSFSSYERSFYLGENIDDEKISATYDKGVLSIQVPKKAPAESKKNIAIK